MKRIARGLAAGVLAVAGTAWAQGPLPEPRTENGVTYVTGGITEDESRALRKEARSWPLTLIFSEGRAHEYLADVRVNIKDSKGRDVLDVTTDGPILSAKLPDGRYSISADWEGRTQKRSASVRQGRHIQLGFNWPTPGD